MADHYGVAVVPARVRKPRDKAKVENAVLQTERWILARLRNRTFFSLVEANQAIQELLARLNDRRRRELGLSRRELYLRLDRPSATPILNVINDKPREIKFGMRLLVGLPIPRVVDIHPDLRVYVKNRGCIIVPHWQV